MTHGSAWWQELVDATLPAIAWSTDCDLRLVTCLGTDLRRLGVSRHQLPGKTVGELFWGNSCRRQVEALHRSAVAGQRRPLGFTLAGHQYRGVIAPLLRPGGEIAGTVLVALRTSEIDARCEAIGEACEERILFLAPDGTIEHINRAPSSLRREELIGRSIYDFVPAVERERVTSAIFNVLQGGLPVTLEMESRNTLGQSAAERLRFGPVRMHDQIVGIVLLAADVTRHKQAVREAKEEEAFLKQLLELQERERQLVAYEIHDGFIQDVVAARMLVESLSSHVRQEDDAAVQRLDRALKLLAKAVAEGRRLISELRPMVIDEMGLVEAIQYLVNEEMARGDTEIEFVPRVSFDRLDPMLQATIFRIIRESVTNAQRHGRARHIAIRLTEVGRDLIIEIQDDGRGFDPERVGADRYGLQGIRDRAQLFGGGATIESKPGEGTRITVKLPTNLPESPGKPEPEQPPGYRWTI